jgi:hypothetical protein
VPPDLSRRARYIAAALFIALTAATAALALSVHRNALPECLGAQSVDGGCFVERYGALTRAAGADFALADLNSRQSNEYLRAMCHQVTHVIGRTAGGMHGKAAFTRGNDLCASGYYHGVVESVMMKIGAAHVRESAASVCGEQRAGSPRSYLHYNCVHGMGHGFMAVFESDVFQSLAACDVLHDEWEQRHCYGGVFMQNLSSFSHSAQLPPHLRPAEPLYPCTVVAARYKGECYIEQTAYALFVRNDDFAAVFKMCREEADETFRTVCYEGLGGDAAIKTSKFVIGADAQIRTLRSLCLEAPDGQARSHCVAGAISTMIRDQSGNDERARGLCAALDDSLKDVCEAARTEEIGAFPAAGGAHHH